METQRTWRDRSPLRWGGMILTAESWQCLLMCGRTTTLQSPDQGEEDLSPVFSEEKIQCLPATVSICLGNLDEVQQCFSWSIWLLQCIYICLKWGQRCLSITPLPVGMWHEKGHKTVKSELAWDVQSTTADRNLIFIHEKKFPRERIELDSSLNHDRDGSGIGKYMACGETIHRESSVKFYG